jgi:peptidoglycan/xylan/chitin deacetylase (PgdA/CDA1 family)
MKWQIWSEIEAVLLCYDVKPILAVVPDNRDTTLMVETPYDNFWGRVRQWQDRGWSIAIHGCHHMYINRNPGIMRLTRQSEFAGLSKTVQAEKLRKGLDVFAREKIHPDCWIAPSHSFDWTTVKLLKENGINVISDGQWIWPHTDNLGITWIPQQLWARFQSMPNGIWTVCCHHNSWGDQKLELFKKDLEQFAEHIINLSEAVTLGRKRTLRLYDRIYAFLTLHWNHRLRPELSRILKCQKR